MIKNKTKVGMLVLLCVALAPLSIFAGEHPKVILTQAGVEQIRASLGDVPIFDQTLAKVKAEVDAEIAAGIDTPIPKDFSGGYTHARHKQNFFVMQKAGVLYQILQDVKYAEFVRDMLLQYEAMYKDLPLHPKERSYARGKLFWQCLNDANWLVYTSQAYDAIYDYLTPEQRADLEDNLFRPFADHLSIDNPQFFNRIHNHSTWGTAAVGMIGLVMGDDELVERALYGIPIENLDHQLKDDDGGFLFVEGQKAGFLANLAEPFSPDGYYTEGPYYQRYAMSPFLIFAQGLHNAKPELKIFEREGRVLINAVDALLNLSDADGDFFPLNDAQKSMSYLANEVVTAVNTAYLVGGEDPRLLDIAQQQGKVLLDDAGIAVAQAISAGNAKRFDKKSVVLSDGPKGKQGGLAVLRDQDSEIELLFKFTAQGLSHGHYDKLSYSWYEKGAEVLQDYGMSRFVNIGQKGGGNYLPENKTWAKQTIAHNALVQDSRSHFDGKYELGSQYHSELVFFDDSEPQVHAVSAVESNAYPDTHFRRTVALVRNRNFAKPIVLDLLKVQSSSKRQFDLPFHYTGQVIDTNFSIERPQKLSPIGKNNGYQHLYLEGRGEPSAQTSQFTWISNQRFYTITSAADHSDKLLLARLGANDPQFNLRSDPAFIIRRPASDNTVFATVLESHGNYNPVTESATNSRSNVAGIEVIHDNDAYTAAAIEDLDGNVAIFVVANSSAAKTVQHRLNVAGRDLSWKGPFGYFE